MKKINVSNILQLQNAELVVKFEIEDKNYSFDLKNLSEDSFIMNGNICSLDWSEGETDLVFSFINHFINEDVISGVAAEEIPHRAYHAFQDECSIDRYIETMKYTVKLLNNRGFLKQYYLIADEYADIWNCYTKKKDNSVLFTILDPQYKRDKLLCERINCLWNALYKYDEKNGWEETNLDLSIPFYFLQDENDNTYISSCKASLGGHKKLKIYGRLDCPSAHRYLERGQYVKYRVFFKDEATAIEAGYRPCARCMKEKYKIWKQSNQ